MIKEDEYTIRKFMEMKTNLNNNVVYKHQKSAAPVDDNRSFPVFLKDEISSKKMKNTLAVDKMFYNNVPRAKLMQDLWKHIRGNVVQLSSSQYFLQKCGKSSMPYVLARHGGFVGGGVGADLVAGLRERYKIFVHCY